MDMDSGLTRRDFTKATTAGVTGLAAGLGIAHAAEEGQKGPEAKDESQKPKMPFRDLGKTGLKVSEISLGAMEVKDAAVVEKAIDDGCNYVDTAASYQRGENEKMVGTVMARRRKEVILATKFSEEDKAGVFKSVDRSLQRLQTDCIDIIQFHGATSGGDVKAPYVKEAFDELKQQGKVRFLGFTTHENQAEILNACVETGYVDSVLVGYNTSVPKEVGEAVRNAREKGVAIVVMKGLKGHKDIKESGSGLTQVQMAIRWLLDKPYVDTVSVGMTSFQELEENLKAAHLKLSALDEINMRRFASAALAYCGGCGTCRKCPNGIVPVEIMRAHMYAYLYDNPEKARSEFVVMGGPAMVAKCENCGLCEHNCPRHLKIREKFAEVASLLA